MISFVLIVVAIALLSWAIYTDKDPLSFFPGVVFGIFLSFAILCPWDWAPEPEPVTKAVPSGSVPISLVVIVCPQSKP